MPDEGAVNRFSVAEILQSCPIYLDQNCGIMPLIDIAVMETSTFCQKLSANPGMVRAGAAGGAENPAGAAT